MIAGAVIGPLWHWVMRRPNLDCVGGEPNPPLVVGWLGPSECGPVLSPYRDVVADHGVALRGHPSGEPYRTYAASLTGNLLTRRKKRCVPQVLHLRGLSSRRHPLNRSSARPISRE